MELSPNLEYGEVEWVYGRTRSTLWPVAVSNPPASGRGSVFLLKDEMVLVDVVFLKGYPVFERSNEMMSFQDNCFPSTKERLCSYLEKHIKTIKPENLDVLNVQKVFNELGLKFPYSNQSGGDISGGKMPEMKLKMPVKWHSRRGQALSLALEGKSIKQIMIDLSATRRAVLSLFHQLHQYHGIGYTLYTNDFISIQSPEDFENGN